MKRLNPNTGLPFKQGDVRKDGYIFRGYKLTHLKKDGFFMEQWRSPISFNKEHERNLIRDRKRAITTKGRANKLFRAAKLRSKKHNLPFDITAKWIEQKLINNFCELTGLPFDFKPAKNTRLNPYSPSLDRINNAEGYTQTNVRVVLTSVNMAINEYGLETMFPIFKKLAKL